MWRGQGGPAAMVRDCRAGSWPARHRPFCRAAPQVRAKRTWRSCAAWPGDSPRGWRCRGVQRRTTPQTTSPPAVAEQLCSLLCAASCRCRCLRNTRQAATTGKEYQFGSDEHAPATAAAVTLHTMSISYLAQMRRPMSALGADCSPRPWPPPAGSVLRREQRSENRPNSAALTLLFRPPAQLMKFVERISSAKSSTEKDDPSWLKFSQEVWPCVRGWEWD